MKVAIITPYYKEDDAILVQCHESVRRQTVACDHFLVADGFPKAIVGQWQANHIVLPQAHGDCGNTPRVLGALCAFNSGYDAVAFLDADNWYRHDHIARMVNLAEGGKVAVCVSNRSMHRPDGSFMFDDDKNDGRRHVDTSCLFLTRSTMRIVARWAAMPRQVSPVCDTVYWETIKRERLTYAHDPEPTVRFRTVYEADFRRMAEPMPAGVKMLESTDAPFHWIGALPARRRRQIRHELGWPLSRPARIARRLAETMKRLAPTHAL